MATMHQIKRLKIDLRLPDQEQARELQQEVSIFCRTELHEILQQAFDLAAPDRYLRIERLELTLPPFRNIAEFRSKMVERLGEKLELQLAEARDATAAAARASAGTGEEAGPDTVSFGLPYQSADVFLHVLTYGVAPWHAMAIEFDDVVSEVIELLRKEHAFRQHLAEVFTASAQVLRRFILQTPPSSRRRILALITGHDESLIAAIERFMDTFVDALTRLSGLDDGYQLLAGEITCRNILQNSFIDNHVFRLVLKELIAKLVASPGIKAHRVLSALRLADMEMESVLPMRWRTVFHNTLALFLLSGKRGSDIFEQGAPEGKTVLSPENSKSTTPQERRTLSSLDSTPEDSSSPESRESESSVLQDHVQGDRPEKDISEKAESQAGNTLLKENEKLIPEARKEAPSDNDRGDREQPAESAPAKGGDRQEIKALQVTKEVASKKVEHGKEQKKQDHGKAKSALERLGKEGSHYAAECRDGITTDPGLDAPAARSDLTEGLPWMSRYEKEEFHIDNAGLVLLAPFFGVVFRDLGYLDKSRGFASEELRIRAVHFSQFLVADKQYPPESSLVLNKIICGMEIGEPMERFIDLTAKERDAAQEVIDSALTHWSALKRTSAPVFRQTFLRHEGILTFQGSSWLLRIERTSVDVLLDTLPWTISIIKHPWMKQPVMVEW